MTEPIDIKTGKPKRSRGRGGNLDQHGLTQRQAIFAEHVSKGLSYTDALKAAYNTDKLKQARIYQKASDLMDKPEIHNRVVELVKAQEQAAAHQAMHDAARIRRYVIERLHHESVTASNDGARVRALELLGKIDQVRLFREVSETEIKDSREAEELREELAAKLARLTA